MKKTLIITLFLIAYFFLGGQIQKTEAAYFQFEPSSTTVKTGETVSIKVNIDAGSDELNGADARILYNSNFLKVQSVTAGSYFPTVTDNTTTPGKLHIAGIVDNPGSSSSGKGTLATIVFQALSDSVATLTIDCPNSRIVKNDINATDILECSRNNQATITIGTGATSSNSNSSSPTPSVLPKSGVFDNLVNLAIPGMILFFLGVAMRLFLL